MFTEPGQFFAASADYEIDQSIRFEDGDSPYLHKTPSGAGNRKTYTFSGWFKRANILGANTTIGLAVEAGGSNADIHIQSDETLRFRDQGNSTNLITTQVFKDCAAFFHLVVAVSTGESVASNRVKLYLNGSQISSFGTASYPAQDSEGLINTADQHSIGRNPGNNFFWDGYMAELVFIDGQALAPTSFGEINTDTGQWVPIAISGLTFGTNGYHITGADSSDLGADVAGSNDYTSSGLAAADQVSDSPTDNHCTLNSLDGAGTLSDGNLVNAATGSGFVSRRATIGIPSSGKWAFRVKKSANNFMVGVMAPAATDGDPDTNGVDALFYYDEDGTSSGDIQTRRSGSKVVEATDAPAGIAADTFMEVLIDKDANRLGVVIGGTAYIAVDSGVLIQDTMTQIFVATAGSGVAATVDFGQSGFTPSQSGYKALSTANLPDPAIADPSAYFQTMLYAGNGSTQSITNDGNSDLQPDLIWIKNRDAADSHVLTDAVRGATKILATDSTGAESTDADTVTAFNSDGFALGDDDKVNTSSENFVVWQWKADIAWSESATGNILASSGRRNTTAGFSIASWTHQTSGNYAIKHGLSTTPEFFLTKSRDNTVNWDCWHKDLTDVAKRLLMTGAAESTAYWVNSADSADGSGAYTDIQSGESPVTNSLFGFQHDNFGSTDDIIGYFWHGVEGFSKFDSYTGNGSTDGPFVYTGFKPAIIIFKNISASSQSWEMFDHKRDGFNDANRRLYPNASDAEPSASDRVRLTSNGFKIVTSGGTHVNGSGNTIVYAAWAASPFKTATAR